MTTNLDLCVLEHREIRLLSLKHESTLKDLRYASKIINLAQPPVYHALSYCWGAAVADTSLKTIIVDGLLKKVRPTLYKFLKEMAANHSGILIWIDSLCINQENVAERNQQVSIMADIYCSAESVYVWLGQGDEDTSYAIEHIRDCKPKTKFVLSTFSECVEKLFKTSYWTRRWVIQEFALAKKLTIACGKQQTTWDQVIKKTDTIVPPKGSTYWETIQNFELVRDADRRKDLGLLRQMGIFNQSRCTERRDRAFALRGIAGDGQQLRIRYDESVGDLYFRILSMLSTERILPIMTGYRWPHRAAKELIMSLDVTKCDLLNSLSDGMEDLLFTTFEYVGTVVNVEDCSTDKKKAEGREAFLSYSQKVQVYGSTTRLLYGRKLLRTGDVVYTLQSTSQSPKGLYIALTLESAHLSVVGLLLDRAHGKAFAYWQNMQLTEQRIMLIEETLTFGVVSCRRNISAKNSLRILCHIKRKVLIMLWLLDIGQIQYLCDHEQGLPNLNGDKELKCCCVQGTTNASSLNKNAAIHSRDLEILPSIPISNDDEQWKAASAPWSRSPLSDHKSDDDVWQVSDTVDFRARGRTQFCYAAMEGHILFATELMSKLAVGTRAGGDTSQKLLPVSYGYNNAGVDEPTLYGNEIDPNIADDHMGTLLSWKAPVDHKTVINPLLNTCKVELDSSDDIGSTPLSWAARNGHEAIVKLLLERIDIAADPLDKDSRTPLSWAARNGYEAIVKLLVTRNDVEVDSKDNDGHTSLWWAVKHGDRAIVKLLITRKIALIYSENENGQTPLLWAAQNGYEAIVKLLVTRNDVEVDSKDNDGHTSLWWAVEHGTEAIVKLLVARYHIAANATDNHGRTLLFWAARRGHKTVVKLLLELYDVKANSMDKDGRTTLWRVVDDALQAASYGGYHELVQLLLGRGADVNAQGGEYGNALQAASCRGHDKVVQLLLEWKADVNAQGGEYGNTLQAASYGGCGKLVQLLLSRGADVNAQGGKYGNALQAASCGGHDKVVQLLLEWKADVNAQGGLHGTALNAAVCNTHKRVIQLLMHREANIQVGAERLTRTLYRVNLNGDWYYRKIQSGS